MAKEYEKRRYEECARLGQDIMQQITDITLATAGTMDAAYSRFDVKFNQGTATIFITRDPRVVAVVEAAIAREFDVNKPLEKGGTN
jgi:hypothetical protein